MTMPHEIMVRSHPQSPIPESVSSAAKVGEERNIFRYVGSETAYFEGCFFLDSSQEPSSSEAEQVISRRDEKWIQSGCSSIIHTFS